MVGDPALQKLIDEFEGEVAFLAVNLLSGAQIGYRPERGMPTASTIKILVLAELARQIESGRLRWDDIADLRPEDRRGGSGILKDLAPDLRLSLRDHAVLMTALSDNTSTMLLVRLLGKEQINASGREWGLHDTFARFEPDSSSDARRYAESTPADLVQLLALIARDQLVSPAESQTVRDILLTQQYHEQIARYLPFAVYERSGADHVGPLLVRSKSGFMSDEHGAVRVDAGIVEIVGGPSWVLALMTEHNPDRQFHPEHSGMILNGRISRLIYDRWAD